MELLTQDFLKSIAGIDLVLERFSEIEWEAERKLPDTTFKENKNYTIDELKEEKKLFLGIVRKLQAKIEQERVEEHIKCAPIEYNLERWEVNQIKPSDFSASKAAEFKGIGFCTHRNYFDPTDVEEDSRRNKIWPNFVPTVDELITYGNKFGSLLCQHICAHVDLSVVSDTVSSDCTKSRHLDLFQTIFPEQLVTSTNMGFRLGEFGCGVGCASSNTACDGYFVTADQSRVLGVLEVRDNTMSPSEGLRQAVAAGTNVAVSHLATGVPWDDIMIPLVSSTGYLFQFACIALLEPSFPFVVILSKVLDLTDFADRRVASAHLVKLLYFIRNPYPVSVSTSLSTKSSFDSNSKFGLLKAKYHLKDIAHFFASQRIDNSLMHFFRVMGHLHDKLGADRFIVVFPICVRVFDYKQHIVFPNLCKDNRAPSLKTCVDNDGQCIVSGFQPKLSDFRIGLPNNPELRQKFLEVLTQAMTLIHSCGVAHLDLYLSNIMWRVVNIDNSDNIESSKERCAEKIVLKIVDWDSARFCDETLDEITMNRLKSSETRMRLADTVASVDNLLKKLDISLINVLAAYIDDEALQSGSKDILDSRFRELQQLYLQYH